MLLFGVEYSLDISKYSLIVTLVGIEEKCNNSHIAIFSNTISSDAIRSLSQLLVFPEISSPNLL